MTASAPTVLNPEISKQYCSLSCNDLGDKRNYDYGFRDYSPVAMRFTTVDPIRDGMNWYAYVEGDPINNIDMYGLYTQAEWELLKNDPLAALEGKTNADKAQKAVKYNDTLIPGTGHNDDEDAVRHAYWSAMNASDTDEETARKIGEAHEDVPLDQQSEAEKNMDLHNNEVGINIGVNNPDASDGELFEKVLDALDDGLLQTSPDDCPRVNE